LAARPTDVEERVVTELERRYRRLLKAFPRRYRAAREDEMVATLLETARPEQRRPSAGEVTDILGSALAERMGVHAVPGFATGLRLIAPLAATLAAGLAVSDWWQGHRDVLSTVVSAAWVAGLLVAVVVPRVWTWLLGGLTGLLVAAVVVSGASSWVPLIGLGVMLRPGYYSVELAATVVALLAAVTVHWRPSTVELGGIALVTAGLLGVTATGRVGRLGYGPPWLVPVPALVLLTLVAGLALAAAGRGTGGLWATLLLVAIVPSAEAPGWPRSLVPSLMIGDGILLMAIVTAFAVWLAATNQRRPGEWTVLNALGGVALGVVGAVAVATLVAYVGHGPVRLSLTPAPIAAAAVVPWLPRTLRRPAIAAAIVALLATAALEHVNPTVWLFPATLAALLVLAAAVEPASPRLVAGAAGLALLAIGVIGGLMHFAFRFPADILATLVGTAPLMLAVIWSPVAAVRAHHGWLRAVLVFAVALLWVGYRLEVGLLVLVWLGAGIGLLCLARLAVRLRPRAAVPRG
jgi:hypothetical protein